MTRREFILQFGAGVCAAMVAPPLIFADERGGLQPDISSLSRTVNAFLATSSYNRISGTDTKIYGEPLFGVSSAHDPLYRKLKEAVGPDHCMPEEFLPDAKSVVSFFLPYTEEVSRANYGEEASPSLWVLAHRNGAAAAEIVRRLVIKGLASMNGNSIAPFHDSRYRCARSLISSWSERHVAFVSGIGTFGLHKSIITEKGSSGRLDSIVTDLDLAATKRNYNDVYGNCAKCFACVRRCPVGAIKETGKNIQVCAKYVLAGKSDPHHAICGKCLTQTPCENCLPKKHA